MLKDNIGLFIIGTDTSVGKTVAINKSKIDAVNRLEDKVLSGQEITPEEARELGELGGSDLYQLFAAASRIRDQRAGKKVDLCSIVPNLAGVQKTVNFVPSRRIIKPMLMFMIY